MSKEYTSSGVVVTGNANITNGKIWLDTIVSSGGYLHVNSGGIASNTVIADSDARVKVYSSGLAVNMVLSSGGSAVVAVGQAESLDIKRGG